LPDLHFDVVGSANTLDTDARRFLNRARELPNITLHGAVPHTSMDRFYQDAQILLSTSSAEGFPSVFIEAWSWGLPVVAALDVDGLISQNALGVVGDSVRALADGLRGILRSRERWTHLSHQARAHYIRSHNPTLAARAVASMLTFPTVAAV
jgi:glycosyltransferase involved in cell wall biosynthesis